MSSEFKNLLSPMKIGKVTFKNRIAVCPMGGAYGNQLGPRGEWSKEYVDYVAERARGGFGLFFGGCLFTDYKVDPCDPYASMMTHKEDFIKQARLINERAAYFDMKIIQQITMGLGRNYAGLLSPSENEVFGMPGTMSPVITKDQIRQKMDCLVEAAQLMKDSNYTGVEIHALHWGYLLDQFAMAITNKREDEYGGSLENRLRICKDLVKEIKQACGSDFPVTMRLGVKSYMSKEGLNKTNYTGEEEGGRTLEEGIRIAKLLEEYGYDALNCDVGVYDTFYYAAPPMYLPQGFVIPLVEQVKKEVNIPVLCCSRMNDPYMNEAAIAEGRFDGIVIGRQSLADPQYVKKLEIGRPQKIRPCIGCESGCIHKLLTGGHVTCAVNPAVFQEGTYGIDKAVLPKKIAVVGGGVAGMEAARIAKLRGHDVTIYEKTGRLGGMLIAAGAHEFKKEVAQLSQWYQREIADLQIPVIFNRELNPEQIKALGVDAVVLALGSKPLMPRIAGIDHLKCVSGVDVLSGKRSAGARIIVVGGGLVGCETAMDFAMQGKDVTIVEAAPAVLVAAKNIPLPVGQMIPDMLAHYGVKIMAGHKIEAVNDIGAVISPTEGGKEIQLEADTVVLSIGMCSLPSFEKDLLGCGFEVFTVGDLGAVGNVHTSIHSAYEVARRI